MSKNNNAKKGVRAEKEVAKGLGATRKAGANNPDARKGKDKVEIKDYKNPLTLKQLQNAKAQNNADIIVSVSGYSDEALEHAKKNMKRTQLRSGKNGKKLTKRRYKK